MVYVVVDGVNGPILWGLRNAFLTIALDVL